MSKVQILSPRPGNNPFFLSNSEFSTHNNSPLTLFASGLHPATTGEYLGNMQIPSGERTFSLGGIFLFIRDLPGGLRKVKSPMGDATGPDTAGKLHKTHSSDVEVSPNLTPRSSRVLSGGCTGENRVRTFQQSLRRTSISRMQSQTERARMESKLSGS